MQHSKNIYPDNRPLVREFIFDVLTRLGLSPATNRTGRAMLSFATGAALVLGLISIGPAILVAQSSQVIGPIANVNPFVGTGRSGPPPSPGNSGPLSDPGNSDENLYPGAVAPFGMVQLSPDTESKGFGYHYFQNTMQGFSMTHMGGVGCDNSGDVFFTATTGPVMPQVKDFQSSYTHDQETAAPGYYQVRLPRWNVNAELTATDHTGIAQFTFPAGQAANILLPISHTLNHTLAATVELVGDREVDGYVVNETFCGSSRTYKVYFTMTFDRPFSSFGTWSGERVDKQDGQAAKPLDGNRTVSQTSAAQWVGGYASWAPSAQPQTVTAKVGISYVDLAGAKNNLSKEAAEKNFLQIRSQAQTEWNKALGVIDVSGGTPDRRRVFYTALYHCLLMPSIFNDIDGRYLGFDNKIHQATAGHQIYANYSGWDIYRSEMPLLALIEPQRMQDMVQSIALMYQQGGWIDRWPRGNQYTNVMAGSPLSVVVSTAWLDGLHNFDIDTAWQGMLRDATEAPPHGKTYQGEGAIQWINQVHYVPDDKEQYGSVSQLQEDAVAYASLYRLAANLGKSSDAKMLYERSLYYRNLFDPQDRFFRPRNAGGQWVQNFDPSQSDHGFIEGSGWHYQWFAPMDMAWLIHAMGPDLFNSRLTTFFDYKTPGWYGNYYNPYNETDLEAPFEFNFSGRPWESQRVVRRILKENYLDTPDGIPGNDDCGEMSSWAVMSMMGFYSVDPASLAYELVSPVFPKVTIRLRSPYTGKSFNIETTPNPQATPYIQAVQLNGQTHAHNWISFHDISDGGTLRVALSSSPNKSWGSAVDDAPPSLSDAQP